MSYHYYPLDYKPHESTPSEYYLQYGEVYKNAIQILLEKFMKKPPMHDYSLAPILFLLRQYIELQLKGIIMSCEESHRVIGKHDIVYLYERANKAIEKRYGIARLGQPNKDVVRFIYSLGEFDKKAQAFRYPETKDGKDFFDSPIKMDPWLRKQVISLPDLNEIAQKVIGDLEGIEGYLDFMKENEEEYLANLERP